VDSLEIAGALELNGMSDAAALDRYGYSDVFALAEEMYQRVPRRPAEPEPPRDPWQFSKYRPVLHALLYGLPAVCFPAATGLLTGPGVIVTLVVALLVAWSLGQGLAHLGYSRLGRSDLGAERPLLRRGMAIGLAVVLVAMVTCALAAHAHLSVLCFGAGEGAYMLGACVLMVLGVGRWLLVALAPGVLSGAAFLALGRPSWLEHSVWIALAETPLLALVLAVVFTRASAPRVGRVCSAAELRNALPAAAFGLCAAGLLAFPVAAGVSGHGGVNTGALLASLPISLSMGAAEGSLLWYRRRTQKLLRATNELRTFATKSRLALLTALLQYVAVAVTLSVVVVVIATKTHLVTLHGVDLVELGAYLTLGVAMFLALTVQAFGRRVFTLSACAVALGVEIGFRHVGVSAQVVACGGLLIAIGGYAVFELGKAFGHAY
jgi:hypothetical protein